MEFRDAAVSSSQFMSRSFGTSTLSADLDNLMPFINYEIRVLAENVAGLSGPSNAVQARTHPAGEGVRERGRGGGGRGWEEVGRERVGER